MLVLRSALLVLLAGIAFVVQPAILAQAQPVQDDVIVHRNYVCSDDGKCWTEPMRNLGLREGCEVFLVAKDGTTTLVTTTGGVPRVSGYGEPQHSVTPSGADHWKYPINANAAAMRPVNGLPDNYYGIWGVPVFTGYKGLSCS